MCECIGVNVLLSLCYKCQCVYICTYTANKVNLNLKFEFDLSSNNYREQMLCSAFVGVVVVVVVSRR